MSDDMERDMLPPDWRTRDEYESWIAGKRAIFDRERQSREEHDQRALGRNYAAPSHNDSLAARCEDPRLTQNQRTRVLPPVNRTYGHEDRLNPMDPVWQDIRYGSGIFNEPDVRDTPAFPDWRRARQTTPSVSSGSRSHSRRSRAGDDFAVDTEETLTSMDAQLRMLEARERRSRRESEHSGPGMRVGANLPQGSYGARIRPDAEGVPVSRADMAPGGRGYDTSRRSYDRNRRP
ncbi:hypothetical protein M8818_003824 [Zalaria obscura]|uniref:Uncharacterized protein n=1 Tax=Zalaria obscura TaxID=2024903 RepID=A0ACC3SDI8_9PEZI